MIPTIETRNLLLRPFTADDAADYYTAILSDEIAARALPTGRPVPEQRVPAIIADIADHWEQHGIGLWAVTHKENGKLFGHCGLQLLGHTQYIELAIAVNPLDYAEEAARAVLRYGFDERVIPELVGIILTGNSAVEKVYRRLGMRYWRRIHVFDQQLRAFYIRRELFRFQASEPYQTGVADDPPSD
jgi:ribosomal-protein-alanine N-acetyltransferase